MLNRFLMARYRPSEVLFERSAFGPNIYATLGISLRILYSAESQAALWFFRPPFYF